MLKVKIKNFQSITDTEFEIDGFTVIVGKNNRGKSAIIRAIDAALSNRLGNNFIRWGKLQTEVGLNTDGLDISWVKGDTASYNINKKPFTSLNRTVPKPISDAGFKKLEIADEKLNPLIAHQFEELFLINKSGPFVTEAISTLYNLNDINDADTLCQKKLRASKTLLKTRQADVEDLAEKIKQFNGLDDAKAQWEKIKILIKKSENLKKEISDIECYETQLNDLNFKIQRLQSISGLEIPNMEKPKDMIDEYQWLDSIGISFQKSLRLVQKLKEVLSLSIPDIKKPEDLIQEVATVDSLTNQLKRSVFSCDNCKNTLNGLKSLELIVDQVKNAEKKAEDASFITKIEKEFMTEVLGVKQTKASLEEITGEWLKIKAEYDAFKVCPLCNNTLTPVGQ